MRGWHGMIFGPDLSRFNPTSSNEAQEDQSLPEFISGINSCRNRHLYNPLTRIQRYYLGEIQGLFQPTRRDERANYYSSTVVVSG
jgi:hypothetical protein